MVGSTRHRNLKGPARSALVFLAFVAACFGAALVGSAFTTPSIPEWYASLVKPSFTPPNWLFGPVWSVLYLAMAIAGWLVWRRQRELFVTLPLALFGGQLVLNVLWSILFFGLQAPGIALAEILTLGPQSSRPCSPFGGPVRLPAGSFCLTWPGSPLRRY